jgi:hypothetical protein
MHKPERSTDGNPSAALSFANCAGLNDISVVDEPGKRLQRVTAAAKLGEEQERRWKRS